MINKNPLAAMGGEQAIPERSESPGRAWQKSPLNTE
jgi:hypothetical protein